MKKTQNMMMNLLFSIFKARNILIFQFVLVLLLFAVVRLSPNISFSTLAEKYVPFVAPWVHVEHYNKSIGIKRAEVFGYVNHHSVPSGESFKLFLSRADKKISGEIEVYRIGSYENSDRKMVYKSEDMPVPKGEVSYSTFVTGAAWKPFSSDISTSGWESGYYTINFIGKDGSRVDDVAFVVVTNPQKKGDILIKLSTNTYQAYNDWGGSSLYKAKLTEGSGVKKADVVSFDRPTESHFNRYEYYYVTWIEKLAKKLGLKIDYATNYDFYKTPKIADNYTILMSLGHDEYWTQEEFDAYYNRIFQQGKNTMFLSANTAYWRVRYGDLHNTGEGRQLITYKKSVAEEESGHGPFDPIVFTDQGSFKGTGLFRGQIGYPESRLMGVGYNPNSWFGDGNLPRPLRYPYKVKTIIPWLFEGVDLKKGDYLADVIGPEWDNASSANGSVITESDTKRYIPSLDGQNIQIVFEGNAIDYKGNQRLAQAVYFETDAGAKVFSAGTIRWSWAVGKPEFINKQFQTINENLITNFLK